MIGHGVRCQQRNACQVQQRSTIYIGLSRGTLEAMASVKQKNMQNSIASKSTLRDPAELGSMQVQS